jgi:hypothetical protein
MTAQLTPKLLKEIIYTVIIYLKVIAALIFTTGIQKLFPNKIREKK